MSDEGSIVDAAALTVELETWRKRMFRRLSPTRDHFPELRRLATGDESPTTWIVQDYPPIRDFLIKALDHAQASQDPGQPPDAYSPAVLRCVFGLTDRTMNTTVRERQVAATALIPDAYSHYEMTEPEVRGPQVGVLIAAIQAWHTARRAASPPAPRGAGRAERLFGRAADLEWLTQMRNQLKDTGGLFGIWGLSGIGKTALAEQFAWNIGPGRCATIRVGQPGHYAEDLRSTLTKARHAVPDASTEQYEAAFRRYIGDLGDLWLLILDGVTSPDELDVLDVAQAHVPVLVVADERLTAGSAADRPDTIAWRQIGPLDAEAGMQVLTQHLPGPIIDRDASADFEELTAMMGGHAATLHAVSRLLPTLNRHDFGELLRVVGHAPGESLASLTRFTGDRELRAVAKPLSWIIRAKVGELADDPVALTVLTVLVTCSESGGMHREIVEAVVAELLRRTPWSRELDFAYDRLTQLGLATRYEGELYTERLVGQIARYEVIDRLNDALLAYERVAMRPIASDDEQRFTPLGLLRQEYVAASHLGRGHEMLLDTPTNMRLLRIGPAADNYWAHYLTRKDGSRQVALYRTFGHGTMLAFSGLPLGWEPVENDGLRGSIEAMIDRYFRQILSVQLATFEHQFGTDQRLWPPAVLELIEALA